MSPPRGFLSSATTIDYVLADRADMVRGRGDITLTGRTVTSGIFGFTFVPDAPTTLTLLYRVDGGPQQSSTLAVPLTTQARASSW